MEFNGRVAKKAGPLNLLEVEALKTRLGHANGEESGLFYVPKVIRLIRGTGILETEYIDNLVTLQQLAIRRDVNLLPLLNRAGRALAVIHERLVLPDENKHALSPEWMGTSADNVFIHGDYVNINLGWEPSSDRLVVMDWSAAPVTGKKATYGSAISTSSGLWTACSTRFPGAGSSTGTPKRWRRCLSRVIPGNRLRNRSTKLDTISKAFKDFSGSMFPAWRENTNSAA
jgi:hypothetical protein